MSAADSNLSDPKYRYDLVCGVTELGLNVTLLQMLSEQNQDLFVCFAYDDNNKVVQVPIEQIEAAAGVDPFTIADGTGSNDPVLGKLSDAGFAYAFRAKLGLPAGVPLDQMPNVIALDQGNSQVTYRLFCAEFSVIVMNYLPRGRNTFTNLTQPADAPWLFKFMVNMNLASGAPTPFNQLPPAAQQRIKNVDPGTMFSVQQLLLDVSTRALEGAVSIPGLDPASPAYIALTEVFIGAYWDKMAPEGSVLLGFAATPQQPADVIGPSIVPTDLTFEVVEYTPAAGAPASEGLNTLNYLTVANGDTLPPAVPFTWNWVEPAERANCHGVMAVRRGVFANFLAGLFNPHAAALCVDTTISLTHSGESLYMDLTLPQSSTPAQWVAPANPTAGPDGWTPLLTLGYSHASSDESTTASHGGRETGDFNYALTGDFSTKGSQLRLNINAQAHCDWNYYLLTIPTANFNANIVNLSLTATFTLGVTDDGSLTVTVDPTTPAVTNSSEDIEVSWWDEFIHIGNLADKIETARTELTAALAASITGAAQQVSDLLNHSSGWVYPGGRTFLFSGVTFSADQDLVSRVVYADPMLPAPAVDSLVGAQS